jgi:hypothetical protein
MRTAFLILLCPALLACGNEADDASFPPPARVEIPAEAVVASFGSLSDPSEMEVLTTVWLAALSETGRFLAVGDRAAPFLRVLDRETDSAVSFGAEGRGPGEILRPLALDFHGDSILLVLAGGRLERFGTTGEWLGGRPLTGLGLQVTSMTAGCGDGIFLYGVPGNHRRLDTVPWLHEVDFGPEPSAETRLEIPGRGYDFGWGGLHGFDGTKEGLVLWHMFKEPQVGYWLPCDGGQAKIWSHTASDTERLGKAFELEDNRQGMVLTLPDTLFAGAAARGSVKVRARRALEPDDEVAVTTFHVVTDDGCREVELEGEWTLRDAHADALVLTRYEPFSAVQVIEWAWFKSVLNPAPCAPTPPRSASPGSGRSVP